tara:strand:+ start:916 stop:2889 length:1974 start_codon:yes stop_codon:yes gene_type:complete
MKLIRELKSPSFEKTAGKFLLGENPSTYASELIAHLYKQHSYLGKYDVSISIDGQDHRLGYMYGVFIVKPSNNVPPEVGQKRMDEVIRPADQQEPDKNSIRIPIIVENKKAYSFDVFINADGRFMPLNESRVASALFEASPYSVGPKGGNVPASASLSPNFQPDVPAGGLGGGRYEMGKVGSVIEKLSGVITSDSVDAFLSKVASDQRLIDAASLNEHFSNSLINLSNAIDGSKKEASVAGEFDVAVVTKSEGGFSLKVASFNGTPGRSFELDNSHAAALPLEVRQDVFDLGSSLMVSDKNSQLMPVAAAADLTTAEDTGVYSVISKTGSAQRAVVLSDVRSLAGRKMDMCVVVGPSGAAFQEKVAGIRCGEINLDSLEGSSPSGEGLFLFKSAGYASEPVNIRAAVSDNGETSYLYEHPLTGRGSVKLANVAKPVRWEDNNFLIPADSVFVPLSFGHGYESDTVHMNKVAARHDLIRKVTLRSDGSRYSFDGAPVGHMNEKENLSKTAALMTLGLLGDTFPGATEKLAEADKGAAVSFVSLRNIEPAPSGHAPSSEEVKVASLVKVDLVKEASVLTGADTVDSVLSLNFVTPENVQGYIDMIPDLEQASFKLSELLVGIRLGLSDVPESAVSSSLSGVERAIQGLKKLQIRSNVSM